MRLAEVLEIIRNGENSTVEFKRDDIRPEQLAKEAVAMANMHGGRILIGVEDNGSISGLQRENLEGSTSRLATREQAVRLLGAGGLLHPEALPVSGTSFASLDRVRIENYLRDIIKETQLPQTETDWRAFV